MFHELVTYVDEEGHTTTCQAVAILLLRLDILCSEEAELSMIDRVYETTAERFRGR